MQEAYRGWRLPGIESLRQGAGCLDFRDAWWHCLCLAALAKVTLGSISHTTICIPGIDRTTRWPHHRYSEYLSPQCTLNTSLARVTQLHLRIRRLANTSICIMPPWHLQQWLGRIRQHIIPSRTLWAARSRSWAILWEYDGMLLLMGDKPCRCRPQCCQ